MKINYRTNLNGFSWEALSDLYQAADFGFKSAERLKRVFGNSQYLSFAYEGNQLIGASRAFSDGGDCAVICDMAVLPSHQGNGIGSQLLEKLLAQIGDHQRIMLFATLGKEAFYKNYGFGLMSSGMCLFKNQAAAIASGYIQE